MRTTQSMKSLGLLERLELKFHIPETMVNPISEYVSIYCSPDKYSRDAEAGVYTVNSLYFDSPNYLFLRWQDPTECPVQVDHDHLYFKPLG